MDERLDVLGFIPGSISAHSLTEEDLSPRDALLGMSQQCVVLYCSSGRRSSELLEQLGAPHVFNLEGGVLGWLAAGLPLCNVTEPVQDLDILASGADFVQALRSCFVGQAVETILDFERPDDPLALFYECLSHVTHEHHTSAISYLYAFIDRAAYTSKTLGTSLSAIAKNTHWAYANVSAHREELASLPLPLYPAP